mgnify:CR=1 FL=1
MIKVHIHVRCEYCEGQAYLPIGKDEPSPDKESHQRHIARTRKIL